MTLLIVQPKYLLQHSNSALLGILFHRWFANMFTIFSGDGGIYFSFLQEDPDSNRHQDDSTDSKDNDVGGDASLGTAESLYTFDFSELSFTNHGCIFYQEILIFPISFMVDDWGTKNQGTFFLTIVKILPKKGLFSKNSLSFLD